MPLDVQKRLLECVDELQRSLLRALFEIEIDSLLHIAISERTQNCALVDHCYALRLTRLRRPSK